MKRDRISILSLSPTARIQALEQLAQQQPAAEKAPKYRNASVVVDGYRFPSKRESLRYLALKSEQMRGAITDLRIQPAWRVEHNGVLICDIVSDFAYKRDGQHIVEDVKGPFTKTRDYRIKKKLMLAFFRIDIHEVL